MSGRYLSLINYYLNLLIGTFKEFRYSKSYLKNFFKSHLTIKELEEYHNLLESIYFNTGLMNPMFYEYRKLVNSNRRESRELTQLVSALMLLEDAMLDDYSSEPNEMDKLFQNPDNYKPHNILEKLVIILSRKIRELTSKEFRNQQNSLILKLHREQIKGESSISVMDAKEISIGKGLWFPTIAYSINPRMIDQEISTLQNLGCWIKLTDDFVDREKDIENSSKTVFTILKLKDSQEWFEEVRRSTFQKVRELCYPSKRVESFLLSMYIQTISFEEYNIFLNSHFSFLKKLSSNNIFLALVVMVIACVLGFKRINDKIDKAELN